MKFVTCWEALKTFAVRNDMDADGITSFIADGPHEAMNLAPEQFGQKCAAAKKCSVMSASKA